MKIACLLPVLWVAGCVTVTPPVAPVPAAPPRAVGVTNAPTVAPTEAPTPTPMPTPTPVPGLLVPLYEDPSHPGWARLVALRKAYPTVPVMAIVNPNNGASWELDAAYTRGINRLRAAGLTVLGYVATGYGGRAYTSVVRETTRWQSLYPQTDGIFFDEMSGDIADLDFYAHAVTDAHGRGFDVVVGNPGVVPPQALADTVDILVATEHAGGLRAPVGISLPRERLAGLAYEVPNFDVQTFKRAAESFRWLYVTDHTLDENPWDGVSAYAEAMAETLAQ